MKPLQIPRFIAIRIFILSLIMYYMLVGPVNSYIMMKSLPEMIRSGVIDSNLIRIDTVHHVDFSGLDSAIEGRKNRIGESNAAMGSDIHVNITPDNKVNIEKEMGSYIYLLYLIPLILLIIFNMPFKGYFSRKRNKGTISQKNERFVKKYLFRSPLINAAILFLFFLIGILLNAIDIITATESQQAGAELSFTLLVISLISSLLITLFAYFWHRHRVRFRYIEHVYSNEETTEIIRNNKDPRIRTQLFLMHGITTILPISVILFYILMSLSTPFEVGISKPTPDDLKILIGRYSELIPEVMLKDDSFEFLADSYYINSFDTFLASIGILSSFIVAVIYVIFVTRWYTIQVTKPISSLLERMEKATSDKVYLHATIRTGDEFGKLTAGYNNMSDKIESYINEIEEMNRTLEQKVIERTIEIQNQKNEIEAQRDEIEAQRDEIASQRDMVTEQKDHIEGQKKEITDSITYARRIQSAILPDLTSLFQQTTSGFFVVYKPKDIVSGDFYWGTRYDNMLAFAVADCTGHGVPGAFMSMLGVSFLNEIVRKKEFTSAGAVLDALRLSVIEALKQKENEEEMMMPSATLSAVKDGMDIVFCILDLGTLTLNCAGANNSLYVLKHATGLLEEIKGDSQPVSIHVSMSPFRTYTLQLERGDQLYLTTDGFADQFGGPRNKKFLMKNLKNLFCEIASLPSRDQKKRLESVIAEWKGDQAQVDDITVMGVRV